MGLADDLERRLERAVEGFFSRTFRSKLQPAELGRRILRELEASKQVSVETVYVANHYVISLARADLSQFSGLLPVLKKEFGALVEERAAERRWKLPGSVVVEFEESEALEPGRFEVTWEHEAGFASEQPTDFYLVVGGDRSALDMEKVVIGRMASCDIVVPDQGVSRQHAEITKKDGEWWIQDLGSRNGTLVNGSLVKERRLVIGDVISIGPTEIEFAGDSKA